MRIRQVSLLVLSVALLLMWAQPVKADSDRGKLIVEVHPYDAYIYADGKPVVDARHWVSLPAGEHKIDLYNYGFKPESRDVTITAHKQLVIHVTLEKIPGVVDGPWGCITIEGASRSAVLLNGTDPAAFFVGHADEFNNEAIWHQELIVPPGQQQLTLESNDHDPWTTTVDVQPNMRVIVDGYQGVRKTVPWSRGEQIKELPLFHNGIASAQVAVMKVGGMFSSSTGQVNCGDSAQLTWSSSGAAKVEVNGVPVSASGNETVQPKQSTDYSFTARGPGGVYTSDATVHVNTDIPASLSVTPTEVNYQNNGQGASPQNTATVTWSAPNATSVSIDPMGSVGASGSQEVPVTPTQNVAGPIDQNVTYTLHATNNCGGDVTRTASLHITGQNGVLQGAAAPPSESTTEVAENTAPAMPKTASQLPLAGLIGIVFLAAGAALRVILKISA